MVSAILAALAVAAATPAIPTRTAAPRWLERPTGDDIARAYPIRALASHVSGRAEIACRHAADGRLRQCRVLAEVPKGFEFGLAALRLAPKFRLTPPVPSTPDDIPMVYLPINMCIAAPCGPDPHKPMDLVAPYWAAAPSFEDLAEAFPTPAKSSTADVILECHVDSNGGLGSCAIQSERPLGDGFGTAGLSLVGKFRVNFEKRPPKPTDNFVVEVRIHFSDPKGETLHDRPIGQPRWIAAGTQDQAAALFPPAAAAKGLKTGRGVAACTVAPGGGLKDCVPRPADPDGLGFSEAAVTIASAMRMNPWTDAGGPVNGAHVELPIRFDLSPGEKQP